MTMLDTVTIVGLTLRDCGWILAGILVFGGLAWTAALWIDKTLGGLSRDIAGTPDERDEHERDGFI